MKTAATPLNAEHARRIALANGAPRGQRRARQHDLTMFLCEQMRRDLGLPSRRSRRVRVQGKGRRR